MYYAFLSVALFFQYAMRDAATTTTAATTLRRAESIIGER
jgi:hypothetical protein